MQVVGLTELLLQGAAFGDVLGEDFEDDTLFAAIGNGPSRDPDHCCAGLALPLRRQSLERGFGAEMIGKGEPLLAFGVEAVDMMADDLAWGTRTE